MLSRQELQSKLDESIKKNDIEGVREAFRQGAVPVNKALNNIGKRTIAAAIINRCSIELMQLLIDKGARVVGENDDTCDDDLSFSLNSGRRLGMHQSSYDEEDKPIYDPLQGSSQPYIVDFLLNNGAEIVSDLSVLKQEIISIIQQCQKGTFNDLTGHLDYSWGGKFSDKYYYKVLSYANKRGIKSNLLRLVRSFICNNDKKLQTNITSYIDTVSNRLVAMYVELRDLGALQKFFYESKYNTTLYKAFDNFLCGENETLETVKLIINRDKNSVVRDKVQVITTIIAQDGSITEKSTDPSQFNTLLPKGYTFSTPYQIVNLVWDMFQYERNGKINKAKVVDLIEQYDINPGEILQSTDQCYEWHRFIEEDAKNFNADRRLSDNQLQVIGNLTVKYVKECISNIDYKESAAVGSLQNTNTGNSSKVVNKGKKRKADELSIEVAEVQLQNLDIAGPSRQ